MDFRKWLLDDQYDAPIRQELDRLILRTDDLDLKAALKRISARVPTTAKFTKGGAQNDTFKDLIVFFRAGQKETGLPVLDVFGSLLAGRPAEFLIARFGRQTANAGREIVVRAIEQFATEKHHRACPPCPKIQG